MARRYPMVVWTIIGAGLLIPFGVSVLSEEGQVMTPDAGDEGIAFDWFPEDEDYGYMLEVSPGETDCQGNHSLEGRFTHPSGMGTYLISWFTGGPLRRDDSVHVGPVNSAHLTGPALAQVGNAGYSSSSGSSGTDWFWVRAAFATVEPREPLRVSCSGSDAGLRFYEADAIEPILSSTSTGGVGAELWAPWFPEEIGVNHRDQYTITTEGDYVVFDLWDSPEGGTEDTQVEGEVRINSPEGIEVVPFSAMGQERFDLRREWSSGGTYTIEIDRISKNRSPMLGLLAGFVLEEELGEPFPFS